MKLFLKIILVTVLIICCSIFLFIIDCFIYDSVFPDPCIYHFEEYNPSFLEKLFYPLKAHGHPEAGIFNYLFNLILGITLGFLLFKLIVKIAKKKSQDVS